MAPADPTATAAAPSWHARLQLRLSPRRGRTVLSHRLHSGPLLVQRPFYPELDGTCHLYVLHPPAGIAAGDDLRIEALVQPGARALITTPAATKFYRCDGGHGHQSQRLTVEAGGRLEWLPQENIFFDGACSQLQTRVHLQAGARLALWEINCLGRPAADEAYTRGDLKLSTIIEREGQPIWLDRSSYVGGGRALNEPFGLHAKPVHGTFVATLDANPDTARDVLQHGRALGRDLRDAQLGVTLLDDLLVCRYLGSSAEQARTVLTAIWRELRVGTWGADPVVPRIWLT